MTHESPASPRDALDIIFANRNRAYGAYQLRRDYPGYLARAFGLGLLLIGFFLLLPRLLGALSGALEPIEMPESREYVMGPPPDIATPPLPPPPVETPQPPRPSTQRFVPPDVRPDDKAPDTPPELAPDDITASTVGTVNHTGDPEALPSDLPLGLGPVGSGIIETPVVPDKVFTVTDVQRAPTFPGDEAELLRYLRDNIKYPSLARETGVQGTVAISFVVGKDGSISEVAILKDPGAGCGKEAVRVVRAMPKWNPGEANGHPVRVRFTLPVRFRLE